MQSLIYAHFNDVAIGFKGSQYVVASRAPSHVHRRRRCHSARQDIQRSRPFNVVLELQPGKHVPTLEYLKIVFFVTASVSATTHPDLLRLNVCREPKLFEELQSLAALPALRVEQKRVILTSVRDLNNC